MLCRVAFHEQLPDDRDAKLCIQFSDALTMDPFVQLASLFMNQR